MQREAAGRLDRPALARAARALIRAQPAMAAIARLADAVLAAVGDAPTAPAVVAAVQAFDARVRRAAAAIEREAVALVPPGGTVLTLSASSLVERTLLRAHRDGRGPRVICPESRPGREGAELARRLAAAGVPTELWVDAAAARCLATTSLVLVGADTLAPAGLVHKIGTLGLALTARDRGVPVYTVAGSEKLLPALVGGALTQHRPASEVLRRAPRGVLVANYYYDLTPLSLLAGAVTEHGRLTHDAITAAATAVPLQSEIATELGQTALTQ
jgi:translation initiation factor 2B subunit (eIF-2B alpha/beta/delta family)